MAYLEIHVELIMQSLSFIPVSIKPFVGYKV